MRFGLVGYGRMGKLIDSVARDSGHAREWIVSPQVAGAIDLASACSLGADMVFEFTEPQAAEGTPVLGKAATGHPCLVRRKPFSNGPLCQNILYPGPARTRRAYLDSRS